MASQMTEIGFQYAVAALCKKRAELAGNIGQLELALRDRRLRALIQNHDGSSSVKNVEIMIDRELERQSDKRHMKIQSDAEAELLIRG